MYHGGVPQELGGRAGRVASAMAAAFLVFDLGVRPAHAADTDESSVASASPVDGAPSSPGSAQELTDRAYDLHAAGDYAASIATYLKAYEISNAGVILLNIATIYDRKLHERDLAAEYYRRYLRAADAEPDLVLKATQRLTALKQEDASPAVAARAAVTPPPQPQNADAHPAMQPFAPPPDVPPADDRTTERGRRLRTAGILAGSLGVGSLTAAAVLGLLAKGKNDDANAFCHGDACSNNEGVHLAHQAGNLATASTITFFAGLALAGGGLTMILLAPRGSSGTPMRLALVPSLGGGGGVDVQGGF